MLPPTYGAGRATTMSKLQLCGPSLRQSATFQPFRASSSVKHLLTMPRGKERGKKGSSHLPNSEMASSLATAVAAAASPNRRRLNRIRNPRATATEIPVSPVLMDIEEEESKPAARDSDSEMAMSPQIVGTALVVGTPESMNLSIGNLSPMAVRTLFVDTPSPPAKDSSSPQSDTISIASEHSSSSSPVTSPAKTTDSSDDTPVQASNVLPASKRLNDSHVAPYEYQTYSSEWLYSAMRTSMGDTSAPGIPMIDHIHLKPCPDKVPSKTPAPIQAYAVRYDLCITVVKGNDPVLQAHLY